MIVYPTSSEAELVYCEMNYSPSAVFSRDVERTMWKAYPTAIRGALSFQINDEGHPYWTATVYQYKHFLGCKSACGVLVLDAVTGEVEKYDMSDIPSWVDNVVDGDTISTYYNWYGRYINGFVNFAKKGETMTTDDFGYLTIDNTLYIYTGVTSVSSDESDLGFIVANTRTGETTYYAVPGAEEYSAMGAAEGVVQNYGYEASFPSLIMYKGETPTYVMVLKDSNGLVKMYAAVNMEDYTVVAVSDTYDGALNAYASKIGVATSEETEDAVADTEPSETVSADTLTSGAAITSMQVEVQDGQTIAVITFEDGTQLVAPFVATDAQ